MRVVDGLADTAVDPWTDGDGGATPPLGAASSGGGAGPGQGPDVVGLRPRTDREGAGRSVPTPAPLGGHVRPSPGSPMGLRETAMYGFRALRIGEASTLGPLTCATGIWTASGMLLSLPQESSALTSLWLACVLSTRSSKLRGSVWLGPIRRATRRGFRRLARLGRLDVLGPPPRRSPARTVPLPPRMGVGRAIGPVS